MVTPLQVVPQPSGSLVVVAEGVGFIYQYRTVVGILVGQKNAVLSPFCVFVFLRLWVECQLRRRGYSAVGDYFGPKLVAPVELLPHWYQACPGIGSAGSPPWGSSAGVAAAVPPQ